MTQNDALADLLAGFAPTASSTNAGGMMMPVELSIADMEPPKFGTSYTRAFHTLTKHYDCHNNNNKYVTRRGKTCHFVMSYDPKQHSPTFFSIAKRPLRH